MLNALNRERHFRDGEMLLMLFPRHGEYSETRRKNVRDDIFGELMEMIFPHYMICVGYCGGNSEG